MNNELEIVFAANHLQSQGEILATVNSVIDSDNEARFEIWTIVLIAGARTSGARHGDGPVQEVPRLLLAYGNQLFWAVTGRRGGDRAWTIHEISPRGKEYPGLPGAWQAKREVWLRE